MGKQVVNNGILSGARPLNIGIHLVINALSTILLGARNCCMQCLSAPTMGMLIELMREVVVGCRYS
jgi:hypothetical protein